MNLICGRSRSALSKALATAVALGVIPLTAFAADVPATPEGAQKLNAVFVTYLGKPPEGAPPPITVTPEGGHYTVSLDLAALTAPLKSPDFSIDPAILTYALTEQDDGTWRVMGDALPPFSFHQKEATITYSFAGYKFDGIFDPTLAVFKTAQHSLDKTTAQVRAPKLEETIALGPTRVAQTGAAAANGASSIVAHEEIADMSGAILATPPQAKEGAEAKPIPVAFQLGAATADVTLDGAPLRKVLDLWALVVAHPGRAGIAANEEAFKTLLRGFSPADIKFAEKADIKQIGVDAPQGHFGVAGLKFALAGAASSGAKSSAEYHLAMDGLTMPPGLLPPAFSDLVPTAFNIDVKASGFDVVAGALEAINDLRFDGDGPVIAEADRTQIFAKMKGTGPITIDVLPCHVVAPQIDLTFEGQVRLEGARPMGAMKLKVRNFDKTVEALKALGPLASPQLLGGLALAKTLGKAESDGALTWVAEYGADGAIKVNGMPLGKAP
jgi:Uncharacterized protein conserved in bacteria (DUF2125)